MQRGPATGVRRETRHLHFASPGTDPPASTTIVVRIAFVE